MWMLYFIFVDKPQPPSDSKSLDPKSLMPPLPPLDNENSQDSNSLAAIQPPQPPLPPPSTAAQQMMQGLVASFSSGPPHHPHGAGGIPSLLDPAALAAAVGGGKPGDTDARGDGQPHMPPGHFGMGRKPKFIINCF